MSIMENTPDYHKLLNTEISFKIRSKGMDNTKVGIFLAVISRNNTLYTSNIKVTEHDFSNFKDANTARKRADIAVILVVEDGKTKYFTPRLQQLILK